MEDWGNSTKLELPQCSRFCTLPSELCQRKCDAYPCGGVKAMSSLGSAQQCSYSPWYTVSASDY
eukprot:scaffold187_cov195-Ochromonas_danica.AAC.6